MRKKLNKILFFIPLPALFLLIGISIAKLQSENVIDFIFFNKEKNSSLNHSLPNDIVKESLPEGRVAGDEIVEEMEDTPFSADSSYFSFAVLGDTQYFETSASKGFSRAVKKIRELKPEMIFAVGDLISSCQEDDCARKYQNWKNILGNYISKTYAAQGNHDRTDDEKSDAIWQNSFSFPTNGPEGYKDFVYSFDFKNSHFVILDTVKPKTHEINKEQRDWLEQDLAKNKKKYTFVFFHEPAYPAGSKVEECLDKYPAERDALWNILVKYKVAAVFAGHEHISSRQQIKGIYQFGFGDTNSFNHMLDPQKKLEFSYIGETFGLVKVRENAITVKVYSVDGQILDTKTFQTTEPLRSP